MLRLLLPPNLPAAAARDAIAVKVEVDLGMAPPASLLPALAALQRWVGAGAPPPFLQLTRAQLRELLQTASGQAVFYWVQAPQTPIPWVGPLLRGVSEHVREETPAPPVPPKPTISVPRSLGIATPPARRPLTPAPSLRREAEAPAGMTVDGSDKFLAITLPSRENIAYAAALDLLKSHGFLLEPSNRKWWLRDRHKVLNFLALHRTKLEKEFRASFTANFEKNTAHLQAAEISCEVQDQGDGFSVSLGLRAGRVSEEKLHAAAAANRSYVEDDGRVYLLPPDHLEALGRAQRALGGSPGTVAAPSRTHRLSYARLAEAEDILAEVAPHFQPPEGWRRRSEALRNLSKLQPAPLPDVFATQLRPYQALGVAWLWHLYRHELGGILADEMGLGKTLQAIGLLLAAHGTGKRDRPSLVVCPASLVENWLRECGRFAPGLRVTRHHGTARWQPGQTTDVLVTSYGTLVKDRDLLGEQDFLCLIADEAQHVKNRRTQNFQALRVQHARARFLLTGTPVENSVDDLRTLFDVLMPGYLEPIPAGVRREDRGWYDERLRVKTAPYLLRRTKSAVAPELPPKIEQVLHCEMPPAQARLYRETQESTERALLDLEASGASENALRLATLTQLLRLRQVCCDPRLLGPAEAAAASSVDSAKLELFREVVEEAIDDGHRILVFSQFTRLLDLLGADLTEREIPFARLDGSMSSRARQEQVDRFQGDATVPVFLISLKAGGTGLNLTAADVVIHFDPWWNPAVEAQATDRAHRIGQTKVVTSYKFICSGTVEEKVLQLQETKRALLADVFEASDAVAAKLSLDDLKALLK